MEFKKVIFEWESSFLRFIAHDFLTENFRLSLLSFVLYGLTASFMICEIYTFSWYTSYTRIFAGLYFLFTTQLIVKLYHARYFEDAQWLIRFAENLYEIHITTKFLERLRYFNKFALFTEYLFKGFAIVYISSCCLLQTFPLYMYFAKNDLVPFLEIFIPGIDETTTSGFIILMIYQVTCIFPSIIGVCACDFFISILIINPLMFSKLFALEVQQLHVDLEEKEPPIALKYRLRNILLMHRGINEYMERVEGLTFKIFVAQVSTNRGSSIVALYVVLTMDYLPGYALAFCLLFQIFVACLLGNFIELTNDRVYNACLDLKWNELPHREQHLYKLLIQRCQNPNLLIIGGIAPLNLNICLKIFKNIYSITMLIYTVAVE